MNIVDQMIMLKILDHKILTCLNDKLQIST